MSLSSAETHLIEEAIEAFLVLAHSSVPLSDVSQFYEDDKLRSVLREKRRQIFEDFMKKNSTFTQEKMSVIMKCLDKELQASIQLYLEKNEDHQKKSESFLVKIEDFLCEKFKSSSELHLSKNPYIEIESFLPVLDDIKSEVLNNFDGHWKPGCGDFHEKRKASFDEKLSQLQLEIQEKQKMFLQGPVQDERKLFAVMESDLLDKSEKIKCDAVNLTQEYISKGALEDKIKELEQFLDLDEKKKTFKMKEHRKILKDLLETLAGAKIKLYLAEEKVLPADAAEWAQDLDLNLKKCFGDPKKKKEEIPEDDDEEEEEDAEVTLVIATPVAPVVVVVEPNEVVVRNAPETQQCTSTSQDTGNGNVLITNVTEVEARQVLHWTQNEVIPTVSQNETVARALAMMETQTREITTREATEENNTKRRRHDPEEEEEVTAGTSSDTTAKRRRFDQSPGSTTTTTSILTSTTTVTATTTTTTTESEDEAILFFRLTSDYIIMGTRTGEGFKKLRNWRDKRTTPLVVGIDERGAFICGSDAYACKDHWALPDILGGISDNQISWKQKVTFKLGGRRVTHEITLEFLLGLVLKSLKDFAESHLKKRFYSSVITVPSWFCSPHRIQIKDAGKIAGFRNTRLLNEETVAAQALSSQQTEVNVNVNGDQPQKKYFVIFSENFEVVSAILYEYIPGKLSMVNHGYFKILGNSYTTTVEKKLHELYGSVNMHYGIWPTFVTFMTESTQLCEVFKTFGTQWRFNFDMVSEPSHSDMFGASALSKLRLSEMERLAEEYLFKEVFSPRRGKTGMPQYLHTVSKEVLPKQYTITLRDGDGESKVRFTQKNVRGHTLPALCVGELDFSTSFQFIEKTVMQNLSTQSQTSVPLYAILKVSTEGIVSLNGIEYRGNDGCEEAVTVKEFMWTTRNLSEGKKEEFTRLMKDIWQEKKEEKAKDKKASKSGIHNGLSQSSAGIPPSRK